VNSSGRTTGKRDGQCVTINICIVVYTTCAALLTWSRGGGGYDKTAVVIGGRKKVVRECERFVLIHGIAGGMLCYRYDHRYRWQVLARENYQSS